MKLKIEWCDKKGIVYFTKTTPPVEIGDTITFELKPEFKNCKEFSSNGVNMLNEKIDEKLTHLNLKIEE